MMGEGRGTKEPLACKPHDFEKLRSWANAASDWHGVGSVESWGLRASVSSSPLPLPLQPFFGFRSNFRTITRLETLATQAI